MAGVHASPGGGFAASGAGVRGAEQGKRRHARIASRTVAL